MCSARCRNGLENTVSRQEEGHHSLERTWQDIIKQAVIVILVGAGGRRLDLSWQRNWRMASIPVLSVHT
jgi:hypothetical protein